MHVIVSGASGVVGEGICKWFLNQQHEVTALVNTKSNNFKHKKYSEIKIDLQSQSISIENKKVDAFVHCAALIPTSQTSDEVILNTNTKIDECVFEYCNRKNLKLIYISSAFVYETQQTTYKEENKLKLDCKGYFKSKINSETILQKNGACVFRITSPYGNINLQKNVMNVFYKKAISNQDITLAGKGLRQQNFIHTYDIAQASYLAITKNLKGIYNLGFNKSYTMIELAESLILQLQSKSKISYDTNKKDDLQNVNFDFAKLYHALNWQPTIDLKTGLSLINQL